MEEFISIIVPYYTRFHYLEKLIDSVHELADMPFELIIHDDGSLDDSQSQLLGLSSKVSTIIYNTGEPMGLPASVDRLVALANSKYIIMLNADCILARTNVLSNIVSVLKKPYVGIIQLIDNFNIDKKNIFISDNECKFGLPISIGSGAAVAFRKSVFIEVNGWNPEEVGTCNSDISFGIRIFKHGYFTAILLGESCVHNLSVIEHNMSDSTIGTIQDASMSKIFNYENYEIDNNKRRNSIYKIMSSEYEKIGGNVNTNYWMQYVQTLFNADGTIKWDTAKIHNRFRREIESTRGYNK